MHHGAAHLPVVHGWDRCKNALAHQKPHRHNAFAVRHGKQGLFLTFCEMLAGLFLIPRLSEYFWVTVVFASLASTVTGVYNALQGREWTIPIIGKWFDDHMKI